MPPINYIKGNLFKVPHPAILAHACNTHGFWGGGVAYQFAQLFPTAEVLYEQHCHKHKPEDLLGTAFLIHTERSDRGNGDQAPHVIVCLFTSVGGGGDADGVVDIVNNTRLAIKDLERQLNATKDVALLNIKQQNKWVVDMPMINAGIFRVPWEKTESVLQESLLNYNVYVV